MKNACFFVKNPYPKKDLFKVLNAIVRKFELPRMFDKDYIEFLTNYSGEIDINLNNEKIKLIVDEDEVISHFKSYKPGSFIEWAKEPDGKISQLCLIISIEQYHIPIYSFMNFELILMQLIYMGGLDLEDAQAFHMADTESDQRGLHMSIREEDFGSIYYVQDVEHEPLPFGKHKVADSFSELMNAIKLCVATSSDPYPLVIREIGHCNSDGI